MRLSRFASVCLASFVLIGFGAAAPVPAAATSSTTWTQFHYAATRAGTTKAEHVLSTANVATVKVKWQRSLGVAVYGTPIVSTDRVFAAGYYGKLYAMSRSSGARLWTATVGTYTNTTPALWGSLVIMGGLDSHGDLMAAYDATHGTRVWRTRIAGTEFVTAPAVYGSTIYFSAGNTVYAMSAATGAILWKTVVTTRADSLVDGPVAVSAQAQYVIAATTDGHVIELVGATGRIGWDVVAGGGIHTGGPAIYNGVAYVPEGHSGDEGGGFDIVALQLTDARIMWRGYAGDDIHVTPAAGANMVVIGSIDEGLLARDWYTGALLWTTPYEGEVWGSPVIANGVVYAGTDSGIVAHNAATGVPLWADPFGINMANMSSPAIVDGRIYTGSGEGTVMVFGL
jgi:outer membrane protein assembly factor BamB